MDEVHERRDQSRADLVHLIVDTGDVCGKAWLAPRDESLGFGLTHYACEIGDYTFAHELGHNMGLHHDRYAERCREVPAEKRPDAWQQEISNRPYPYSYGYVNQRAFDETHRRISGNFRWSTIMAYDMQCRDANFPRTGPRLCYRVRAFRIRIGSWEAIPWAFPGPRRHKPSTARPTQSEPSMRAAVRQELPQAGQGGSGTAPGPASAFPATRPVHSDSGQPLWLRGEIVNQGGVMAAPTTAVFRFRGTGTHPG